MKPFLCVAILGQKVVMGCETLEVFAVKRAGLMLLGLIVSTSAVMAQADAKPKSAAEALASAKVKIEEGTTPHRAEIQRVAALLVDEQFDALEVIANDYRDSKERWGYGWWKLTTFYIGSEAGRGAVRSWTEPVPFLQRFNRWMEAYPNSSTAKIATARVRLSLAWRARGSGWAYEVPAEGWAGMHRHLEAAWKILEEAEALNTSDPELYTIWIRVANGLGKRDSVVEELYEKGVAMDAGYPQLYMARAWYLMPRWHGDRGDLEAFARKAAEDASAVPGTGAYAWIAHQINSMTATTTFIHRFEWSANHLEEGFAEILSVYPDNIWIQNLRARLSSLVGDQEEAKIAFGVIGRDFDTSVWPDKWTYGRWKRWAENDAKWPGGNGIHYGVRWDNPVQCRAYLEAGEAIDETDESGFTPLHYAAKTGKVEAARFLISEGADVSDGKSTMLTPLQSAARYGHAEMVELLIEHGADPTLHSKTYGSTPLTTAAAYSRINVIKVLLQQPSIDVDVQDKKGQTALWFAGARGRVPIIKLLLDAGADINHRSKAGKTALYWAQKNKKLRAVQFLQKHGATL